MRNVRVSSQLNVVHYPIEDWRTLNVYLANSADPDQTPQNAASDQGLQFLQIHVVRLIFFSNIYINI